MTEVEHIILIQVASLAQLLPNLPISSCSLHLLQLLLPDRVCCSQLRPLQLLLLNRIHFSCCSLIASALPAAPRLRPLQRCCASRSHLLQRCCCTLIASASVLLLHPNCIRYSSCARPVLQEGSSPCPMIIFVEFRVQRSHASLVH